MRHLGAYLGYVILKDFFNKLARAYLGRHLGAYLGYKIFNVSLRGYIISTSEAS
jgi:hypothetical protein